ncbi:histidine kinase [Longispora sp. NPDC051575]|uniref:sensor histidine kinase n=1 Tax=Longispora sp. NPDC051575 TaxID=3154943 RepID=UPI0034176DB4
MNKIMWLRAALVVAPPVIVWNALALGEAVPPERLLLGCVLTVPGYLAGRWLAGLPSLAPGGVLGAATVPLLAHTPWQVTDALVGLAVTVLGPWAIGRYRRQHVALGRAGWDRAEQLERERRHVAEQARLRERARIASDMHDSLGHALSLIALRAGALELAADQAEHHREAAGQLRRDAVGATDLLRETVGLLREESEPAPLAPLGEPIADLVARAAAAGAPVTLEPAGTDLADRTAYRVVREAVTNAVRHAPGAAITVRVTEDDAATTVAVRNAPPAGPGVGDGRGYGLLGLRERVELARGTLRAGPLPDGGFEVVATLRRAGR